MLKKRIVISIIVTLSNFVATTFAQQEKISIPKGQLLPTPKIVRSEKAVSLKKISTSVIFEENFETEVTLWTKSGSWTGRTPISLSQIEDSLNNCMGTSINANYSNDSDDWLISPSILLPSLNYFLSQLKLCFWEWFQIESEYDHGMVKISTDDGNNWTLLSDRSGSSEWRKTTIDITTYSGQLVKIGFHFTSDDSISYEGWSIDDIQIEVHEPEPFNATMVSLNHQKFPFIYMNVAVDTFGVGFPELYQSNFEVYENNSLQTDYFEVTPPDIGGGVRLADIVFLMDNSGSMSEEINAVSNNVIDFVNNLVSAGVSFALGLCRYGAYEIGGNPIIEDNGILTTDANYFKTNVWKRNVVDGGSEPGYYAITQSSNSFSFRPGAQKIFIIITDETPNQGGASLNDALSVCTNSHITLFALTTSSLYSTFSPITSATNGAYFDIYSNFDDILTYISTQVANNYLVKYKSSNPIFDGTLRNVEVIVTYAGNIDTCSSSYIPGSAPIIQRTQATIDLHNNAWIEGTTFNIEADIIDNIIPYVSSARLYYRKTGTSIYNSTNMSLISGSTYRGIIPGGAVRTPGLDYYITATDGQNTASDPSVDPNNNPYQIAILPNVAPQITHTPVTTLLAGTPITITAGITDNTNSLAGAKLYYRKTGQLTYQNVDMTNTFANNYEAEIPDSVVTNDGVDYYIKAWDDFNMSGNSGTLDKPHQIEPVYDLGFRPNPDGWRFNNSEPNMWPQSWWSQFNYSQPPYPPLWPYWPIDARAQDFPDWSLLVDAFGENQCYWNPPPGIIIYNAFAVSKWRSIVFGLRDYDEKGNLIDWWGGSCFGFAISSFLAFDDKTAFTNVFSNLGNFNKLYDLVINDERRKCINQLWIYQFGKDQKAHIDANSGKKPVQTLSEIKQMFLSNTRDDQILVFFNQHGSGGHAVNPYKIEKDLNNTDLVYIYIYDNNWPNNDNLKITINDSSNTWSYFASTNAQGQPVDWGGKEGLFLMDPVSNYLISPSLPKKIPPRERWISGTTNETNYIEFYNTTNASISIKDRSGNTIGYTDSLAFNNFEDGIPIIPITGGFHPPIGYYIPEGEYSILMQNFSDSSSYFSVFTESTVYSYSRSDANFSQKDYLSYGNGFALGNQDSQSNNISLETIIIEDDNEKVFWVENCEISQNDSLKFNIANQHDLKIINWGLEKSYDLKVRLAAENTDIIFEHKKIEILSTSSHQISPVWDNLETQPVPIFVDIDLDGIFDDTLYVENQYIGQTPPTGGELKNENVYFYPNPFNPDQETGTIRYSLSKSGNVTIKIYDVAGGLVLTIIEEAPRDAGVELAEKWNGKNDKGELAANGVYFYVIESSSNERAVGKAAILR